jgi:hypothetical protein
MSEQAEHNAWIIRTAFSDPDKWEHIRELICLSAFLGGFTMHDTLGKPAQSHDSREMLRALNGCATPC